MLDKEKKGIPYFIQYPRPPRLREQARDGGQAETSIQYHMVTSSYYWQFQKLDINFKILAYKDT
jgi:hypothetical protein